MDEILVDLEFTGHAWLASVVPPPLALIAGPAGRLMEVAAVCRRFRA